MNKGVKIKYLKVNMIQIWICDEKSNWKENQEIISKSLRFKKTRIFQNFLIVTDSLRKIEVVDNSRDMYL